MLLYIKRNLRGLFDMDVTVTLRYWDVAAGQNARDPCPVLYLNFLKWRLKVGKYRHKYTRGHVLILSKVVFKKERKSRHFRYIDTLPLHRIVSLEGVTFFEKRGLNYLNCVN